MKAIRKSDGKIIDVEVHGLNSKNCPISYHTNFKDFYKPEDLDFNVVENEPKDLISSISKVFDWESFRAEAAKDILCAMVPNAHNIIGTGNVEYAIMIADELIKQLKEKEEK